EHGCQQQCERGGECSHHGCPPRHCGRSARLLKFSHYLSASRSSSPRKRGGGFTFEVQQFVEHLSRCFEVKAFAWGVVVGSQEFVELSMRESCEVGLSRDEAAHATDGIFDAALLPGRIRIAKEGFDGEAVKQAMTGELGAIVEGHG